MKPARWIAASLILLAPITYFALSALPRSFSVEEEVREFEQRANAAYEANDLPKYFSFYAADFSQFLPEGRTDLDAYKKEWTAYIGEGNRVQKVDISDLHIQVGPNRDTAVASYLLQYGKIPLTNLLAPGAMGESEQVGNAASAEGQAENRRVVVRVLQNKAIAGI